MLYIIKRNCDIKLNNRYIMIIRLSIDYLTLCEALTAGAFDVVNCQYRGEFDQIFSKSQMPRGLPRGGGGCAWI